MLTLIAVLSVISLVGSFWTKIVEYLIIFFSGVVPEREDVEPTIEVDEPATPNPHFSFLPTT